MSLLLPPPPPPSPASAPPAVPSEENRLLTRSDAEKLLRSAGRAVQRVVRCCDDDVILFLSTGNRPWTAWIERPATGVAMRFEEGFSPLLGSNSRVSDPIAPILSLKDPR